MQVRGGRVGLGGAGALALLLLSLGVSNADAKTKRIPANHDLSFAADVFTGEMNSPSARCERSRRVTLYRAGAAGDAPVGSALTEDSGSWSTSIPGAQAGEYYAVAAKKAKRTKRGKRICKSARSDRVLIEAPSPPVVIPPAAPRADLKVSNAIAGPQADRDYVLQVTASNAGPDPAGEPTLTIDVPDGFTVSAASAGCSPSSGAGPTVVCALGPTLAPGDVAVSVEGRFTSADPETFSSTVNSTTPDPAPADNAAPLTVTAAQCANGVDDDGDGTIDHPSDGGCGSVSDDLEVTQCSDGSDNDGDGAIDIGSDNPDYGCSSADDDTEDPNPQCSNGIDDDGDGQFDFTGPLPEVGCESNMDDSEAPHPQCSNGTDDDGDGKTDMSDPGCGSARDDSEAPDPTPSADFAATDRQFLLTNGDYIYRLDVVNNGPSPAPGPTAKLTVPSNFTIASTSPTCSVSTTEANTVNCSFATTYSVGGSAAFDVTGRFTSSAAGVFTGTITPGPTPPDPNSANDSDSRTITPSPCADGTDNDGDGPIDYPSDPGCSAAGDSTET